LAQSKPGRRDGGGAQDGELRAAVAEIARLEETVKEQAIELVALRGKTRSGWSAASQSVSRRGSSSGCWS
jgi:hypothetical protein